MASYVNNDNLRIWFDTEEAREARVVESRSDGQSRVVEIRYDHSWLPAVASNSVVIDYGYVLPEGAVISSVEILPYEDADSAGDGATLNVGITDADGGSTLTDVDALVVAATQTEMNAGGVGVSSNWAGTSVNGAALTEACYLTWEVDSEAFTAGAGLIRVEFSMPFPTTDTLVWSKS